MKATRRSGSVLVAIACLTLASCGGQGTDKSSDSGQTTGTKVDGKAKKGGTLTVAIPSDPDSLDPPISQSVISTDVLTPMCQALYQRNEKFEPEPQLATALPTLSDGDKTLTIPLRSGVKFNDGTTFDAAAVKKSWAADAKLTGSTYTSILSQVASIDTPDPTTLVLHLTAPYAPMATDLTYLQVTSPTARQKLGDKFGSEPTCVGPFEFVKRTPGVSVTLKKSDLYYDKANVNLDGITFKVITDDNARGVAMRTGAVDMALTIPLLDVAALKKESNVRVLSEVGAGWNGVAINVANTNGAGQPQVQRKTPLAKSPELREALALSIDSKALTQLSSNGLSNAGCSPLGPSDQYFDDPKCPAVDLAKAKKLVEASGYPTPIKIDMMIFTSTVNSRLAEAIQAMVAKSGFELTVNTFDKSTYLKNQTSGDFDVNLMSWNGYPDPYGNIGFFFASNGFFNVTGFNDPAVDDLLDKAIATSVKSERASLYKTVMEKVRQENELIFLFNRAVAMAAKPNVVGYSYNPGTDLEISYAGFAS